jgi:hypothetical protein
MSNFPISVFRPEQGAALPWANLSLGEQLDPLFGPLPAIVAAHKKGNKLGVIHSLNGK